tara:strand:+ start:862 stop:2541 length:1680 start_codon:yes stop_codon:yes gene_type:complete
MSTEKKNFIIGVGGTGMRCLETFTHMCAMGLYDGMEFNVLTLDTDYENGNKSRTEELIQKYNSIKSHGYNDGGNGKANTDTFFSAKINLFKFVTNYSDKNNNTFKKLTGIAKDEKGSKLADLFIDENIQSFNLEHGYRAQTHLGSYLMYHAFVDCARKLKKGDGSVGENEIQLQKFVKGITNAEEDAKIFVFGSIFGGTGASTIPVIPKALKKFIQIESDKTQDLSDKVVFGATLLTEYFSFKKPTDSQKKQDGNQVIADSSFFTLNSQAALQFYESDPTVSKTYSRMYHVGWPTAAIDFSKAKNDKETITGGATQKNQCHIAEFFCGCAAWDFFNDEVNNDNDKATYLFKSIEFEEGNININYDDLLGDPKHGEKFEKRFGNFMSLMHLILSVNQGADSTVDAVKGMLDNKGGINSVSENYKTIEKKYTTLLTEYFRSFGYSLNKQKQFVPGFIYQVKNTVPGRFVLANDAFSTDTNFLFEKLDPGLLNVNEDKYWKGSKQGGRFSSTSTGMDSYDDFLSLMKDVDTEPKDADHNISTHEERLIAHLYKAINKSIKVK